MENGHISDGEADTMRGKLAVQCYLCPVLSLVAKVKLNSLAKIHSKKSNIFKNDFLE